MAAYQALNLEMSVRLWLPQPKRNKPAVTGLSLKGLTEFSVGVPQRGRNNNNYPYSRICYLYDELV